MMRRFVVPLGVSVMSSLGAFGCTSATTIQPSELPKLNEESTRRAVETTDGEHVAVRGSYSVEVESRSGEVLSFDSPVRVTPEADGVLVASETRDLSRLAWRDIRAVTIRRPAPDRTALLVVGVTILVAAAIAVPVSIASIRFPK